MKCDVVVRCGVVCRKLMTSEVVLSVASLQTFFTELFSSPDMKASVK